MKSKIYKPMLFVLTALLAIHYTGLAQQAAPVAPHRPARIDTFKFDNKTFQLDMGDFGKDLKMDLKDLSVQLNSIAPKIAFQFKDLSKDFDLNIAPPANFNFDKSFNLNFDNIAPEINFDLKGLDGNFNFSLHGDDKDLQQPIQTGQAKEKIKNYSKSYPIDGNDKIKLSNKYGKIVINTWTRHEVKVDVEIKAEAMDDEEAQKLLDGVHIADGKEGDLVFFKTEIQHTSGSFTMWDWGNRKVHKIEINYTVYMPAKTDLDIENAYGATILPDLQGRLKIRSSYGSLSAQNLTNPLNEITGGYGSLKIGLLNGGHVVYSYGSVDINQCNNLKADVSYGSFKLGSLRGTADLDLSYVGGFKIDEMTNSFKKLTINSSYTGISLGVPGDNNFDFDITTTYGGFNYHDENVTITEKSPSDTRRYSSTKSYKGHFGKGNADALINIRSTYGSVVFR